MIRRNDPRWAYLLVTLATLFWAGNMTLGRALRGSIGSLSLTALRVVIASLLFLLVLRSLPTRDRRPGGHTFLLVVMALTGVLGFPVLLYVALKYTTASNASMISGASPLITALLAALFLHERLRSWQIAGALISFAGVFFIVGGGVALGSGLNLGDLLAVVDAVLWGLYSVVSRVVTRNRSSLSATAFSTWFALPLLIPLAGIESVSAPPQVTLLLVAGVLYIGVLPTFVSVLFWNEGVRRVGPARAMAFYNMLPVFGALFGAIFLGERLGPGTLIGGLLVIAGGLLGSAGTARAASSTPLAAST